MVLGCGAGVSLPALLPSEVSVVVRLYDGSYQSVLVPLARNARHEVDTRIAEGVLLYDGDHLWAIGAVEADDGWAVAVDDTLGAAHTEIPLGEDAEPVVERIERGRVWLRVEDGLLGCTIETGDCAYATQAPELVLHEDGPGGGFTLVADDEGTVRLRLPLDGPTDRGAIVATNVERVVAVRWERRLLNLEWTSLNRVFRGRGVVEATPRDVVVDGELDDWVGLRPLVVDAAPQVDSGMDGWHGPRDGSFSIAAAISSDGGLCFGGRVRDDHLGPDDRLVVQLAGRRRELPLDQRDQAPGSATRSVWYGTAFETCYTDVPWVGEPIPFTASFTDVDPGESTTTLRVAPLRDAHPLGAVRRADE